MQTKEDAGQHVAGQLAFFRLGQHPLDRDSRLGISQALGCTMSRTLRTSACRLAAIPGHDMQTR